MRTTLLLALALSAASYPATADDRIPGGALRTADGAQLTLLESRAELVVSGDLVTARVTQVFENDAAVARSARYLFPLPHDAAVHAMTLTVGDEVVRAKIDRIEAARATFEAARAEGKTAALLEEHRANVFTQDVANIPPKERVEVAIEYAGPVARQHGRWVLHFPMAVGARYANGQNGVAVPALDKPNPAVGPARTAAKRARVQVRIEAGQPIASVTSPSHRIEIDAPLPHQRDVFLADGQVMDDRDFVLEYTLAAPQVTAGLLAHRDARGQFFSLLVEPPSQLVSEQITPRELVFVLDVSCSMAGKPMEASKSLVDAMLSRARPTDLFRIVVFGSSARELTVAAMTATPDNLALARAKLEALSASGGTEIETGIRAALEPAILEDRTRMVLFLTDGFIGDEASVMATIHEVRGRARLYAFGVGDSVNRWLLEEMAIAGHGTARIVGTTDDPMLAAREVAAQLDAPVLTDAWIDWGDAAVSEVTPHGTFDLFHGAPLRIMGRLPDKLAPSSLQATLVGRIAGKSVKLPLQIRASSGGARSATAIPLMWARAEIAERMRALARPMSRAPSPTTEAEHAQLVREITDLGLTFAITTRWTGFVAVAERTVDAPAVAVAQLPPPVSPDRGFAGSSAPEPATWAAMLMMMAMAAWTVARRREA